MDTWNYNYLVVGGDIRQNKLYRQLFDEGYNVIGLGICNDSGEGKCDNLQNTDFFNYEDIFEKSDIVIGPIPCSKDGETVFSLCGERIYIKNLFEGMHKGSIFIAGMISDSIKIEAEKNNIKIVDFYNREEVAVMNALPTAEGALQIAMEQSDITIHSSKCIVLGFGRCGKAIAKILKGVGADVYVTYRNKSDAAMIATYNYKPVEFKNLKQCIKKFNFIFNTIPSQILNKALLSETHKKAIIIDIAQAPGGVDYAFAKEKNIKAFFCPGLPGIVAPETAAKIIKESIFNIFEEGELLMG